MLRLEKAAVVAGLGEIGRPIYQLCCGGFVQVIAEDPRIGPPETPRLPVLALHITFPGELPNFVDLVAAYSAKYRPEITLVHATTMPGTMDRVVERLGTDHVVHSQVHGKHRGDRMRRDMLRYPKFVATASDVAFAKAKDVLVAMGQAPDDVVRLSKPLAGEMGKLLATTFFGYLVAWAQEMERLSDRCGVSFEELMAFTRLGTDDFRIDNKTSGVIGGHCVMPNIAILRRAYPSPLWDWLEQSNEQKKARDHA